MKQALIFFHGNLSDTSCLHKYLSEQTMIICADGGAEYACRLDILPDVVIGDFDSISVSDKALLEKKNVRFILYPKEKDYTDAELAVQYAIDQGVKKIVITGLLGDRIDHMLANVFYLAEISRKTDICIIEKDQAVRFVDTRIEISGKEGDEVSLIPIQMDCHGVNTDGLYYPLTNASLPFGSTRGISNVMLSQKAKIEIKKGLLMVIHRSLYP